MAHLDPRIDAYIDGSLPFAQPILAELRARVHATCPGVGETIKWGMPTFLHAGKILCGMAAFKQHVSFGYWQHALVVGEREPREGMGSYGKFASLKDMPGTRVMQAHLRKAMQLIDAGVKTPSVRKTTPPKPRSVMPPAFAAALAANAQAKKVLERFPPGQQREYIEWIADAKRDDTRDRRIAQAIAWLAEGKRRNWKYERC